MFWIVSFGILFLVLGAQTIWRPKVFLISKCAYFFSLAVVFCYLVLLSYLQYRAFMAGPLGLVLWKPSGPNGSGLPYMVTEFLPYIRFHIWNTYLVSFVSSIVFFFTAKWLNAKRGDMLFEKEELWVGATAFFLVGYPGVLFYLALMLVIGAGGSLFGQVVLKRDERFSFYFLWSSLALFAILLIEFFLSHEKWWSYFGF